MEYVLFVLVIIAIAYVVSSSKNDNNYEVADPGTKRNDLLYGYYGCAHSQVEEVKSHVNLHWEAFFEGLETGVKNIKAANMSTVIDVAFCVFTRVAANKPVSPRPVEEMEANLRSVFDVLRTNGVLDKVVMIVPIDEPNLPENLALAYLPTVVNTIKNVCKEYPELANVLLGCIYYNGNARGNEDLFDVIGFDDYDAKSSIFAPGGDYQKMKANLKEGQKTLIIPGGSYGQDPTPFMNYANGNAEVWAVLPFLWYPPTGADMKGIRDLSVKDAYIAAGTSVIQGT